jgi:uncharacterized protein (DUF952 family)
MLYHMLPAADWAATAPGAPYRAPSLATEGFIHCSGDHAALLTVGNSFYRNEPGDWLVLVIDEAAVDAPVQWDAVEDTRFPHIYGPLNRSAVVDVVPFPRTAGGAFVLPPTWQATG